MFFKIFFKPMMAIVFMLSMSTVQALPIINGFTADLFADKTLEITAASGDYAYLSNETGVWDGGGIFSILNFITSGLAINISNGPIPENGFVLGNATIFNSNTGQNTNVFSLSEDVPDISVVTSITFSDQLLLSPPPPVVNVDAPMSSAIFLLIAGVALIRRKIK
ncbi:MAG: hypothetical protein GY828_06250 [Candidatus Gracilibacteria bacterium]|nr:hypothetical protein [Candidatus Gracilibacteria bacterium]